MKRKVLLTETQLQAVIGKLTKDKLKSKENKLIEESVKNNVEESEKTKKTIRLTESQIKTLVEKVMVEQENNEKPKKIKLTESQLKRLMVTVGKKKK